MNANHFGKLKKENGAFKYMKITDKAHYETFLDHLPEGAIIELFMEEVHDDGSLAQLAKVHAMIRELSKHTGDTFSEMKMLVKERAGLCLVRFQAGREFLLVPSFGDCDKDQLSAAIQACIEIGEQVNHPVQ